MKAEAPLCMHACVRDPIRYVWHPQHAPSLCPFRSCACPSGSWCLLVGLSGLCVTIRCDNTLLYSSHAALAASAKVRRRCFSASPEEVSDKLDVRLRKDVKLLGSILGHTIEKHSGERSCLPYAGQGP